MADFVPEDVVRRIQAALFADRKIEAIKLYREATSKGLAEAKETVEAMQTELRASAPERFRVPRPSRRRVSAILVLFGLPAAVLLSWGLWQLGNAVALSMFGVQDEGKLRQKHVGWVSSELFGLVIFDPVQKTVEITGQSRFGGPPPHPRNGTVIPVVYWEGKPETARWNAFGVLYLPNLLVVGAGLFCMVAVWATWSGKRKLSQVTAESGPAVDGVA